MILPKNIRPMPFPFSHLPYTRRIWGYVTDEFLYLRKNIYFNLVSDTPTSKNIGILYHEQTHFKRAKKMGVKLWKWSYVTSRQFRFREEIAAYSSQIKYLQKVGEHFDTEAYAKALASWVYLWSSSYTEAKKALDGVWGK